MNYKYVLAFLGGGALGGIGTWLGVRRYYADDAEDRVAAIREHYRLREEAKEKQDDEEVKSPENYRRDSEEDPEGFPKVIRRDGPAKSEHVDYGDYYDKLQKTHEKKMEKIRESLHPLDDGEDPEFIGNGRALNEEEKEYRDGKAADEEHELKRGEIEIITGVSFHNEYPEHDKPTLLYYTEDGVLATEENEKIDEPEAIVGTALEEFRSEAVDDVYVRNYSRNTDYWIERIDGFFDGEFDRDEGGVT